MLLTILKDIGILTAISAFVQNLARDRAEVAEQLWRVQSPDQRQTDVTVKGGSSLLNSWPTSRYSSLRPVVAEEAAALCKPGGKVEDPLPTETTLALQK